MADLILPADKPTTDLKQYHLEQNLTASCLRCWSTGSAEREIPMQCYISVPRSTPTKARKIRSPNKCTYTGKTDLYFK